MENVYIFAFGLLCGICFSFYKNAMIMDGLRKKLKRERQAAARNNQCYLTMNAWMMLLQKGKNLENYLKKHNYRSVAIYGMGNMGERLYDELRMTDIDVLYGIDKNAENIYTDLKVYTPNSELEKVDVVVVTAVFFFDSIEKELKEKMDCPIVSLEKIIEEIL